MIELLDGPRISKIQWGLSIALVNAARATCTRRKVGYVLVNSRHHILSSGYNGPAAGLPHCIDVPCSGAKALSGMSLDLCEAIHAEQNALLQCKDVWDIHTAYGTASPCVTCVKLLMNTSCQEIVFIDEYPHPKARELWLKSGRLWTQEAP